jgi:hypothetical protein
MSSLLQLLSILVGIMVVVYQLGRQHKGNLALQRENLRHEQRMKLFDSLTKKLTMAESAVVNFGLLGFFVPSALKIYLQHSAIPQFQPAPVRYRFNDLIEQRRAADAAVAAVLSVIEHKEVIYPALVIFRYAIAYQSEKCRSESAAFFSALMPFLPVDPPPELASTGVQPRSLRLATEADISGLEDLGRRFQYEGSILLSYMTDLSREIQNKLLGQLFDMKVHPRRPLDPTLLVIGTSKPDVEALEQHLGLATHMHPEAMPSKLFYPAVPAKKLRWWLRRSQGKRDRRL